MQGIPPPPTQQGGPEPSSRSNVPPDLTAQTQQYADKFQVTTGPSGASVIIQSDSIGVELAPSQTGIEQSSRKDASATSTATTVLPQPSQDISEDAKAVASYLVASFNVAFDTMEEPARTSSEDDETFVFDESEGFQEQRSSQVSQDQTAAVVNEWTASFTSSNSAGYTSSDTTSITTAIETGTVTEEMLVSLAGMDISHLPESLQQKFSLLAQGINEKKDSFFGSLMLSFPIKELLYATIIHSLGIDNEIKALHTQTPPLSESELESKVKEYETLETALMNVSFKISTSYYEKTQKQDPPSEEWQALESQDSTKLSTLFSKYLPSMKDLPQGVKESDVQAAVQLLAKKVSEGTKDLLESPDSKTIEKKLETLFLLLVASENIPDSLKNYILTKVLPTLAAPLSKINEVKLTNDLKSSDSQVIEHALEELSGINISEPPLTPEQKSVCKDYLKALVKVLTFMSQIRALIAELERSYTQELSDTKLKTMSFEINAAMQNTSKELLKIQTESKDNLTTIEQQRLNQILMPVIAVVLAIITVVSVVVSILSGGAAAPACAIAIAKLVALCVAFAVAAVSLGFTIADAVDTISTGYSFYDRMLDDWGITDKDTRTAVNVLFNLALIIVTAVVTVGVGAAAFSVILAAKEVAKEAIKEAIKEIMKETLKALITKGLARSILVSALLGAALPGITLLLKQILKAAGMSDQEAAKWAGIIMLILLAIVLLPTIVMGAKAFFSKGTATAVQTASTAATGAGTATAQQATAAATGAQTAASTAQAEVAATSQQAAESAAERAASALQPATGAAAGAAAGASATARTAADEALQTIKNYLSKAANLLKNSTQLSTMLELLQTLAGLLQVIAKGSQASTDAAIAEMKKSLARLTREMSDTQATLELMENLRGLDQTKMIEKLSEGTKEMQQDYSAFIGLIADFINDANQAITALTSRA